MSSQEARRRKTAASLEQKAAAQEDPIAQMDLLAQAASLDMNQITAIRAEIGVGQVVQRVNSDLTEFFQEKVVETDDKRDSSRTDAAASLLGLVNANFHNLHEKNSTINTTRLLALNPEETKSFDGRKKADYEALQSYLNHYVDQNASQLLAIK